MRTESRQSRRRNISGKILGKIQESAETGTGPGEEQKIMAYRNIGIFAHVDAGKTTLSEHLLVHSGKIREAGSVDRGTAYTDDLPVERRRGISVRATCVSLDWRGTRIQLIDVFIVEILSEKFYFDGKCRKRQRTVTTTSK